MSDSIETDSRNQASRLLGMAFGLAHMCCGAAQEVADDPGDVTDVVMGLRHITGLVGEAKDLMAISSTGTPKAVVHAHAVCSLVRGDIAVDDEGRPRQHWNDEITAWSLHALCDVIKRAKDAVDVPASSEHVEVSHG